MALIGGFSMRIVNTGSKYHNEIIKIIKLRRLPSPSMKVVAGGILGISWTRDKQTATIVQHPDELSNFSCQIFLGLKSVSHIDVDLKTNEGYILLIRFLDEIFTWL